MTPMLVFAPASLDFLTLRDGLTVDFPKESAKEG